jgi:ferredoxin
MGQFKIIYDREGCIGAGTCATISKDLWTIDKDGHANLKGAVKNAKGKYELVLDESQRKVQETVCGSCPSGCILIEKA